MSEACRRSRGISISRDGQIVVAMIWMRGGLRPRVIGEQFCEPGSIADRSGNLSSLNHGIELQVQCQWVMASARNLQARGSSDAKLPAKRSCYSCAGRETAECAQTVQAQPEEARAFVQNPVRVVKESIKNAL